jgi:hypothetical protein
MNEKHDDIEIEIREHEHDQQEHLIENLTELLAQIPFLIYQTITDLQR